ncbi:hypothetical protein H5410_031319 [Solanum commersonii]|uniref:Uncharacterized protein n=1 Tax=Solanum commersonii TaxID=4109 RepID=A0A9J5YIT4_SOLCO|nr:hypothetical protein H5410_031319 [Solanum commersonii]
MTRMEQELEILREELCQVQDLAKLSATTFPTFKTPIYFPKEGLPSADLPNQPELTQHAPTHSRVPPTSPTKVKSIPDLSNCDPIVPIMQQILGAHVATPYEPHVPHVYVAEAPTFIMLAMVNIPYEVDQYAKMEKDARLKEDVSINSQLHDLRKALKSLQGLQSGSIGGIKKKKKGMFQLSLTNREDHPTNTPTIPNLLHIVHTSHTKPYVPIQAPIHQNRPAYAPRPRPNLEARNARVYTLIVEPYAQLFERLRTAGVLNQLKKNFSIQSLVTSIETSDALTTRLSKDMTWKIVTRGVIKCTPTPPNVNKNPLPNHENREVNMVTLDEEYGGPDCLDIDEPDAMTSSTQPIITVQLREPLTIQTYLLRLDGATFHTLEIMQAVRVNEEAEPDDTKLSNAAKMVALEILKYGISQRVDLGQNQASDDHIVERIGYLFMAMAGEEEEINLSKLTIRDAKLGEILQNWTISPTCFNQSPGSVEKKFLF